MQLDQVPKFGPIGISRGNLTDGMGN